MTTYFEKPFKFDNEAVKKNTVKVTAGQDVNEDYRVIVDVFIEVEREYKYKGEDRTGITGYFFNYSIYTEDGGIKEESYNCRDCETMPDEIKTTLIDKSRTLAHDKLDKLQKVNIIQTASKTRENIEALKVSGITIKEVVDGTLLPQTTVHRIMRGTASVDNISLRNAEILSAFYERYMAEK